MSSHNLQAVTATNGAQRPIERSIQLSAVATPGLQGGYPASEIGVPLPFNKFINLMNCHVG